MDKFHDECGLFGVWNHSEAANIAYLGLCAQQHRGQEGAGVVSIDDSSPAQLHAHKGLGLVHDVFGGFDFSRLPGRHAIGHVRYTTAGGNIIQNVQPFHAEISLGKVALAHNGNLINTEVLRRDLIQSGAIFASTSDTEIILHLLARTPSKGNSPSAITECLISALQKIKGAYCLLVLMEDRMFAVRDPNGFRPLSIGYLNGAVVIASETCAFDLVGARYVRDVAPGEVVEVSRKGEIKSYFPFGAAKETPCIFEYIYFSRPDSTVYGRSVYLVRKRTGAELARIQKVDADVVVPVLDSGISAALGYAEESGIPLELGLIRNHYIGRTFIEPKQSIRDFGVKIKLNANPAVLRGKSVVVVDDSIVRGTTSRKLVKIFREAGAREIHMRISAPPTIDPCFYGIDTPLKEDLIASRMGVPEIAQYLGVDSLAYLTLEALYRAVRDTSVAHGVEEGGLYSPPKNFCDGCFTGNYPVGTPVEFERRQTSLF